ncbi:MAG: helix-turn-helix domain-containing protein [Streptomyces sp.]|nr:helix-turn-helix domain-containing protein [Streptomyces sp.]NUS24408.1 helix-turn-helix domain-containing protein [Streptomyces sp.]
MTTITATAAAHQAGVTTATIRTWCRTGVITAAKHAGRWIIDAASLAYRIKLPALLRRRPRTIAFTTDSMVAIGGNRWQRNGMDRVYLNDWADLAGIDVSYYGTGNISSASWQGEHISNSQAAKLLGSIDKVWYDTADGKLHCRYGYATSRVATPDEVWAAVVTGVRAAIAAL